MTVVDRVQGSSSLRIVHISAMLLLNMSVPFPSPVPSARRRNSYPAAPSVWIIPGGGRAREKTFSRRAGDTPRRLSRNGRASAI